MKEGNVGTWKKVPRGAKVIESPDELRRALQNRTKGGKTRGHRPSDKKKTKATKTTPRKNEPMKITLLIVYPNGYDIEIICSQGWQEVSGWITDLCASVDSDRVQISIDDGPFLEAKRFRSQILGSEE